MELFTRCLCVLIVSTLSLCGATEYYVRPSEPTNTSCPAQPCLTLNEYASHSEHYFQHHFQVSSWNTLVNTSIIVRNVHNVSFTSFENKRSPLIVFYKWNQYKNVPRDKLTTDMCTPFGFWNATSVNIDRLDMLVYQQNKPVDCWRVFGIIFANVTQLYLHHCNITIVRSTYSSFCSSYFIDSLFGTAAFSTTLCYQGSLYITNGKNIEITKSTIVGGIEVYESAIATISDCNVLLVINRYIGTLYISKSRNIDVSDIMSLTFLYTQMFLDAVMEYPLNTPTIQ